jgi:pyruvate formate lyase activating enzyme
MSKFDESKGNRGIIFNIQGYSIHDGPGIRTTVFFKGCPLRCYWCQNPESQALKAEVLFNRSVCILCGRCVDACPSGAAQLSEDSAIIDRKKCSGCGTCIDVCPVDARNLVGKYWEVDEVMAEVLRDRRFYESSGGGVTLSGGEPMAQPEFALNILKGCKEEGLHTALDTCGHVSWSIFERLLEYTDLVLYDIKCINTIKHKEATGQSNDLILENAKKVYRIKPMRVRVPLIPGFNDSIDEVRAIAGFVNAKLGKVEIDLLPYNKLAEGKNTRLNREVFHQETQSEEYIQILQDIVKPDRIVK